MALSPFISFVGRGAESLAAPGVFTGAKAYAFGFRAQRAAMQATADALLNPANRGLARYETFTDRAMATFMDIQRCTSAVDAVGWTPGRECALWIPLLERDRPGQLFPRLVMWSPYIYISYGIGMLTGRDVWGWPKVLGKIRMAGAAAPARFECATMTFDPLAPATKGRFQTLIAVSSPTALGAPANAWGSGVEAATAFLGSLGALAAEALAALGVQPRIPAVAMKQLRDSAAQTMAVHRAIVDSPVEVTSFRGGGLLGGNFTLRITTCESHRIVGDFLGVAPNPGYTDVPVDWAGFVDIDFKALPGNEIVPSP